MELSRKALQVSASPTLAIDAKFKAMKADGIDVIGFGCGEPDFDTPDNIKAAAIKAIEEGQTKYTPASGTLALKQAICDKLKRDNGLDYKPSNIVVSNGAKHSLLNAFNAIINPGDEIIVPAPYWVSYTEMIKMADGVPVIIETKEEDNFKFTAQQLRDAITPKTKALVLNSPSNPTGMLYGEAELREIAEIAVENDIFVVADEIYEKLIYDGKEHVSIASFNDEIKDRTIIINGVSKSYAMTGWRIGFTAANEAVTKAMANMQSHAASNPSSISQAAALEAYNGEQETVEEMRKVFEERRNYMVDRINSIAGVSCRKPEGAFYVMMNIKEVFGREICGKVINTSDDFCEVLLENSLVALVPGLGFGIEGYVRWSYATSMENIVKGLDRLEAFLK
ncbi:MAG: pyridoxal phosphate-dependent aminotransferase [Clostridia bacterium]|nr:pyridoxal phosphate-dependent aminotransferase [Clostridia bacterium]